MFRLPRLLDPQVAPTAAFRLDGRTVYTTHHSVGYRPRVVVSLRIRSQGYDFRYALARVAQLTGLETDQILEPGKQPARVYARSLICHWAIRSLGMTAVAVSKLLGIDQSAATRAAYRGEAIVAANSLELVERQNA